MRQEWRSFRENAFLLSDRWMNCLAKGLHALHQGFWLGAFETQTLKHLTERQYTTWERYQSSEYNLSGLFRWEELVLDRFFKECRSILVGASGGGREILALSRRGFDVDAFECSETLRRSSRCLLHREGVKVRIVPSHADAVPEELGIYGGLVMGWGGYTHIIGRNARVLFLRQFRKHVKPGGPLLLSFFARSEQSRRLYWVCKIARLIRVLRGSREVVELGDTLDRTFDHHFTRAEIRKEIEDAGFEFVYFSAVPYAHIVGRAAMNTGQGD